ncbi:MAG: hypothetical protein PVG11_02000, partial [Anaerolineae bacterium]
MTIGYPGSDGQTGEGIVQRRAGGNVSALLYGLAAAAIVVLTLVLAVALVQAESRLVAQAIPTDTATLPASPVPTTRPAIIADSPTPLPSETP